MGMDLIERIDSAVVEDKERGVYRCRRDIFTDEALYELEMKHIFEGNWVYLAHESQIPEVNDYFTTWIGRQPIVITRDKTGELNAMINACAHRGAMLCRRKHGNKGSFTCPFHGWTFSNAGKLLKVKDGKTGDYPASFNTEPKRAMLMLAGGTGLAPILSMLELLAAKGTGGHPVHLVYGAHEEFDLVELERLEELRQSLPGFTYVTTCSNTESGHPRTGRVHDHITLEDLKGGDVDIYLCGPPEMVESVKSTVEGHGLAVANLYYEKFVPAQSEAVAA